MLEGLEISEVTYSEVVKMSNDFRINSEFFSKQFLQLKSGRKLAFLPLKQLAKVADGDHSKFPDNQLEEVRYLQARDITNNFLEITSDVFVSNEYFSKNQRSIITEETILLSIMGTVGDIAITPKGFQACMCNRALAIIRDIKTISPQFLFAFLITKQAANLIDRLKNGGVQQRINLDVLGELEIPNFGNELQDKVTQLVLLAQETRQQAKQKYAQAEKTLLEAVGLADFKPSTQNTNIKTFAQSFGTSGRLDAEYYQPKYEDYLKLIFDYKDGWAKLAEICTLKDANFNPTNETNYQYIELSDIDKSGGISGCTKDIGENLPSRARRFVNAGDVVVSSIEGSLSSCALVPTEYDNSLCSTGFYVIKSQEISSETLLVLMKSELMQNILKQSCSGTILTAMNKDEFSNLPIPKIDLTTQTNISQFVQQSFSLKAQSEHLLSVAKRAVEIAIEQDEAAAMHFIENSQ